MRCQLSRLLGACKRWLYKILKRGNGDFARNQLNREARRRACSKTATRRAVWGESRCGQVAHVPSLGASPCFHFGPSKSTNCHVVAQ
jgi:hypothetical protein